MIADFREYYNISFTDVLKFDGSLPVWEAAVLARKLPPSSRTVAAQQGGEEYWGWTLDRYMLAAIVDALNASNYMYLSANSKKKPKAPKPVPRPGDEERKRQQKENNPFAVMVKKQMDALKSGEKKKIVVE